MNKWKRFIQFFQKGIWENDLGEQNRFKRFCYGCLRISISSVQGFINDQCFEKASTLTFYSLLAIIPLVAISFAIAQELGFADSFIDQIKTQLKSQPQVAEKIIQFAHSTLKNTKGGIIASFGVVILFWTVLRTIGNIAIFFDDIWKVKKNRTLWQQMKSYTPLILLFPVFLAGSSSVIIYMSTVAISTSRSNEYLSFLSTVILYVFDLISYLVGWGLLSFLYIYLPNTKVLWKSGIIAGIITGIIFYIWQWIYITFQVHASSYGVIYGSFAAVPLFLIWLNYSWLIVIFGAELSCHIQQEISKKLVSQRL